MIPTVTVFGYRITTYGLMIILGILAIIVYFKIFEPRFRVPAADVQLAIIYGAIGAFAGAKILYLLTVLPQFAADLQDPSLSLPAVLISYLTGGFVFYGGVYGACLTAFIYCRHCRIDWWEMAECLVPVIPLFHVFGRIGCFLTGCCYGVETPVFGIAFSESEIAPNGVPLLPVQLIEAAVELLLFILLIRMARRPGEGRRMLALWLIAYSLARFVLEFFRGDPYRGYIGPFSTSQIIAVLSILVGTGILWYTKVRHKNTCQEEGFHE